MMDVSLARIRARRLLAAFVMAGLLLFSPRVRGDEPVNEASKLPLETQPAANEGDPAVVRASNRPDPTPHMPQGRTWPAVLTWTAGGVCVVGLGVAIGSHIAAQNAMKDANASFYTANAFGCYGAAAECAKFNDAYARAITADAVSDWALGMAGLVPAGLLAVALWGAVTDPVEIQAVPTVGGIVFRGTF